MTITKLTAEERHNDWYTMHTEKSAIWHLSADNVLDYKLVKGMDITPDLEKTLWECSARNSLLASAFNSISRRLHAKKEIEEKLRLKAPTLKNPILKDREIRSRLIEETLEILEKKGYIDDLAFAAWYVDQKNSAHKPLGPLRINQELARKGVSRDIREQVLTAIRENTENGENGENLEESAVFRVATQKMRSLERETDHRKKREKLLRALMSRGFPYQECARAVDTFLPHP